MLPSHEATYRILHFDYLQNRKLHNLHLFRFRSDPCKVGITRALAVHQTTPCNLIKEEDVLEPC